MVLGYVSDCYAGTRGFVVLGSALSLVIMLFERVSS